MRTFSLNRSKCEVCSCSTTHARRAARRLCFEPLEDRRLLSAGGFATDAYEFQGPYVFYVDDDAPDDPAPGDPAVSDPREDGTEVHPFDAIQEAIDAAGDGEMVLVLDGTYTGQGNRDLDFLGKAVAVRSRNGPDDCIIDCRATEEKPHRGFYFHSGETSGSIVEGFTITGGYAAGQSPNDSGGAIHCVESSPTIKGNLITENRATASGGGIYCGRDSMAAIVGNTIIRNRAGGYGGGIECSYSRPLIENNVIARNTAFSGSGGGIYFNRADPATFGNNTVVSNRAAGSGGIAASGSIPPLTNCIVWGNGDDLGYYLGGTTYCCIQDGASGAGNLSAYPHFVDPANDDYRLRTYSPCIDAGDDSIVAPGSTDIDGQPRIMLAHVDIGADEAIAKSPDGENQGQGDGLPDDWETEHFGDTAALPETDPDGDGLSNLEELRWGYDPNVDNRVIYVDAANSPDPLADGSRQHPLPAIQQGVRIATEKVLVARGDYSESLLIDAEILDVEGGYDPAFTERDPQLHTTTVDAGGNWTVVTFRQGANGSLSGFTLTGGNADRGGGVSATDSSPTIMGNTITGNTARVGGGVACADDARVSDNLITENTALTGAGVYCAGHATVSDNTIVDNVAEGGGGGVACYEWNTVSGNVISRNRADHGGGVWTWEDYPATIIGNVITENYAQNAGGGIAASWDYTTVIAGNLIARNATDGSGGAIHLSSDSSLIINNTILDNTASDGVGGIDNLFWVAAVVNCIVWGNGDDLSGCTPIYSCIEDDDPGEGNIHADPLLVDAAGGDYRLSPGSPCIDAADSTLIPEHFDEDLDGNPRLADDPNTPDTGHGTPPIADMGAYEFQEVHVLFVDVDATGSNTGTSWANAFANLQDALSAATANREIEEIRVAQGVYRPAGPDGGRDATFQLISRVAINGGYAGYGEADPNARHIAAYKTILSGDLNGDDGPNFAGNGENSYHVVTGSGCGTTAVLDGFTITDGNANGESTLSTGGGMYSHSGSPTLINCIFTGNSADSSGGGLYNSRYSNPTLINCLVSSNSSSGFGGGGMHNSYYSSPTLINCTFSGNWADHHGCGVYNVHHSKPTITNCVFWGNQARDGNTRWITQLAGSDPAMTHGCIQDADPDDDNVFPGAGNIDDDPLFAEPYGADNLIGTEDENLRLLPGSPCLDAGSNAAVPVSLSIDLDAEPRIANGTVDMGCFEGSDQGLLLSDRSLTIDEGTSAGITVALAADPGETVEVIVAHHSGDPDFTVADGYLLTFDSSDYSIPKAVTLAAAEDADRLDGAALIWVGGLGFTTAGITLTERDNDVPAVLYVDQSASGANNGGSWSDAYTDLQDAVQLAGVQPQVQQIHVAEGVYVPAGPGADRTATFRLRNGLAVYGGFPAGGGTWAQRDPDVHRVVLTGDLNRDDVEVGQAEDLLSEPTRAENSYHVVTAAYCYQTTVLDGFTVTGGNANGESSARYGGGVFAHRGRPTLSRCTIVGNAAATGGGMRGNGNLSHCTFSGNAAQGDAGAMGTDSYYAAFTDDYSTLSDCTFVGNWAGASGGAVLANVFTIGRCEFIGNSAGGGGAIDGAARLTDCNFSDNLARGAGGAIDLYGWDDEKDHFLSLTRCTFTGNEAYETGGAMNLFDASPWMIDCTFVDNSAPAGGAIRDQAGNPRMDNCLFSGNTAQRGGAIMGDAHYSDRTQFTLNNCTLSGNTAVGVGGGIAIVDGSPTLNNCLLADNSASEGGALALGEGAAVLSGCRITGNSAALDGGAVYVDGGEVTVAGCTITGNRAEEDGGGVYCEDGGLMTVTDCTIAANEAGSDGGAIGCDDAGPMTVTGCTITDNRADDDGGGIYSRYTDLTVTHSTIADNQAREGGGFRFRGGSPTISYCTITGNDAPYEGGGGIYLRDTDATIANCMFRGNGTDADYSHAGGGIYCHQSSPTITDCAFVENYGGGGAGVYCGQHSDPAIVNCTFVANSGFAVTSADNAAPTISNCAMIGNSEGIRCEGSGAPIIEDCTIVDSYGGAVSLNSTGSVTIVNTVMTGNQGGVYASDGNHSLIHCTILNNKYSAGITCGGAAVTVRNSIVFGSPYPWGIPPDVVVLRGGGTASITFSDIEGGYPGEGNFDADPMLYMTPGYWDDGGTPDDGSDDLWTVGDYRLLPGSPCIDAGMDAGIYTDTYGNVRPFDVPGVDNNGPLPEFDVGAHESDGSHHGTIRGGKFLDLDGDGVWDTNESGIADWTIYLDLDGDGLPDDDEPSAVTGPDGSYSLTGLLPGTYTVAEVLPNGWGQTLPGLDVGGVERVSLAHDGLQTTSISRQPSVSADGRYVAFASRAIRLVPGDTGPWEDVFVYDRDSDTIRCISTTPQGTTGDSSSHSPSISADGRYVAFASWASDLSADDTNGNWDIFLYDCQTETIELVSLTSHGSQADSHSYRPVVSPDGRYVAFRSWASNLVARDTNGHDDIFVRDRLTGVTQRVSVASNGTEANSSSYNASISADGRYVAFDSFATNLVPGDTNGLLDAFVYDRQTDSIECISGAADGGLGSHHFCRPSISGDGRYVAFLSDAPNLVPGDDNDANHLFLFDRQTQTVELLSVAHDNSPGNGDCREPSISTDGRYVAFASEASNLVPGDSNHTADVFVLDRLTGTTQRVSLTDNAAQSNASSSQPSISTDGRHVAFVSEAFNLVPGDTNWRADVFISSPSVVTHPPGTYLLTVHPGQLIEDVDFGNRPVPPPAEVVGRHVFYNNSAFDANDPGANPGDDDAIAPDKEALLPGGTADFANYTSYSRGINGIIIDVQRLNSPDRLDAHDFEFHVGNNDHPDTWLPAPAPAPTTVTVRPGEGTDGSHRVTLVWDDNAVQNQWLLVSVLATRNTGLVEPDLFYFGNAIGESGNSTTDAKVDAVDVLAARDNPRTFLDTAPIDFFVDFNRDARVNAIDMLIARDNPTHFLNALKLITVPPAAKDAVSPAAKDAVPGPKASGGGDALLHDAVFEQTSRAESGRAVTLPGRLDWLGQFDHPGGEKRVAGPISAVSATPQQWLGQ